MRWLSFPHFEDKGSQLGLGGRSSLPVLTWGSRWLSGVRVGWDLNPGCWGLGKLAVLATRHTTPPHISVLRSQSRPGTIRLFQIQCLPTPAIPSTFQHAPFNRLQQACFINSSCLFDVVIISLSVGIRVRRRKGFGFLRCVYLLIYPVSTKVH